MCSARNNIGFHPNIYVWRAAMWKSVEVGMDTSLNMGNLQGDTDGYHNRAMYENYRYILQNDTGLFAWLMACNSFISELKIVFEIPKRSYSFEDCNWPNGIRYILMLRNSEILSIIDTWGCNLHSDCVGHGSFKSHHKGLESSERGHTIVPIN